MKDLHAFLGGLSVSLALLVAGCVAFQWPDAGTSRLPATFPNGVAAGDVDQHSAVLWARSTATGPITFTYGMDLARPIGVVTVPVAHPQIPVTVTLTDLPAGATLHYRVQNTAGDALDGRFRTTAPITISRGLRFGVGADWRGDLAPFPAVANAPARDLDFFIALGDVTYADFGSPATGYQHARTLEDFRRKYDEVYGTHLGVNTLAALRASTALFVTIDDHEVLNNFAGGALAQRDHRFPEETGRINDAQLYEDALQAFFEYHPLRVERYGVRGDDGRMDGEYKLYRFRTFGRDAALFLLDGRSFRDLPLARANPLDPDDVARFRRQVFRPERTLLGPGQLADLKRDLLAAQEAGVTWKFIATPEPMQYRGLLSAQDRWEGYAAERTELLRFIQEQGIRNVVFLSADIHGVLVNNLSYRMGPDGEEIPVDAWEVTVPPVAFNPPMGPVLVEHGVDVGLISPQALALYRRLPVRPDADQWVDDKDDWLQAYINEQLRAFGQDDLGLTGSSLDATLLAGDYVVAHVFGWTEFAIAPEDQTLTVTTYGIAPYGREELASQPVAVLARQPQIVSQFQVRPVR